MMPEPSIDNTQSLFQKLERSFERRPLYGEYQLDWVFDTAVTAWHLVDWYSNENGKDLATVRAQFINACPALAVCWQICNGSKHLMLDDPKLKPFNVKTDVFQTEELKGIRRNVFPGETHADIVLTPVVRVTDKNRSVWEVIELFRTVLAFWEKELSPQR